MEWRPDKQLDIPIYQQIANYIQKRIAYGEYPPGTILPSERKLAKELEVNRATIVTAYDVLYSNGMIERIKGSGTRVHSDVWGLTRSRVPNWDLYVERGSFLPNLPLFQQIRSEVLEKDLINFASGELASDLMPNTIFKEILSKNDFQQSLGYDHPQGNLELRNRLVAHLKTHKNIDCSSQSILITSGAQQALYLVAQCLLEKGDAVAYEDPSYAYSLPIFRTMGLKTFNLPVNEDGINPEDIIKLYQKHNIKMLFLNPIFQNPTGTILPFKKRKRVLEITNELGIPVVEDDPYSLVSFSKEIDTSTLKSIDDAGSVLYISSFSKIAASGLRIGWIIGPDKIIQRLADAKQQIDFGHSIFPQWLASEYIQSHYFDQNLQFLKDLLTKKRNILISCLMKELSDELSFHVPAGGIHIWCKLHREINEYQLLEESLRNGVAFVPGSLFGSKKGYIRLTFGRVESHLISEGVQRLKRSFLKLKI
ncbi:PLP-dependent aminotransferase family protein [Robertmurraya korlensis]|uniref:MocR-like pyridoxine biosynthesis transcription factor PdxR n=1 Tax=Robertmurraya korlensis TaxID=519977 RepID=UPI0020425EE1|nr:PLP-dependent aminotransferase family protein [Robertmurraya korlensis]MCM3601653.1 PLP-dependent aminotransferase family protein [Robertmurraya korlensis]